MLQRTIERTLPIATIMALTACGAEFEGADVELAYYESNQSAASLAMCAKIEQHCERRNLTIIECNEILESRGCDPLPDEPTFSGTDFNMNNGNWDLDIPGFNHGGGDAFGDIDSHIEIPGFNDGSNGPDLGLNVPGLEIPTWFGQDDSGDRHRQWVRELDALGYDAYTPWRFIGIKADPHAACPQPAGNDFVGRALFGEDQGTQFGIPEHLAKYCLYTAPIGNVSFSQNQVPSELMALTTLNGSDRLLTVEPDHISLSGSSSATAVFQPQYIEETYEHTGKMAQHATKAKGWWIDSGYESYCPMIEQYYPNYFTLLCADFDTIPTRVGIIDSTPTQGDPNLALSTHGHSRHGHGLANLADNLLCDDAAGNNDPTCLGTVTTQMAMPFYIDGGLQEDPVNGGDFGSISWLAEGIYREVQAWRNAPAASRGRLVINLSLGWSPQYGGDPADAVDCDSPENPSCKWPNDVKTVYAALNHAHCSGAIVIAAAGNETGGPAFNTGALLPGLWESLPAPSDCSDWVTSAQLDPTLSGSTASYAPLLYAASGIDYKGDDIAIARRGGRARLSAYADHAVAAPRLNADAYTDTLTGTSVSTTVLASAAAAVWFYRPDLSSHEVMEILYDSGADIELEDASGVAYTVEADFCLGGGCGPTRRVSVCEAAKLACQTAPSVHTPCPTSMAAFPVCNSWDKSPLVADETPATTNADLNTELEYVETTFSNAIAVKNTATCGASELTTLGSQDGAAAGDQAECPSAMAYGIGARPWTAPQPFGDPCPDCAMSVGTSLLTLTGNTNFNTFTMPTLSVESTSGTKTHYSLGSLNGMNVSISLANISFGSIKSASFTGIGSGGSSMTSSLYLKN